MTEPLAGGRLSLKPRLWQSATIAEIVEQSPRVKSFMLKPSEPFAFTAGQHAEVRLTAPDGYRAQRSYSISSAPETPEIIELTIEKLDTGEVSPFFHEVAAVGDEIEMRGPLGGHFIWSVANEGPLLLVGGGSGVCPLISMIRHRQMQNSTIPIVLLFSARTWDEVLFREELMALQKRGNGFELVLALTREPGRSEANYTRRIDQEIVAETLARLPGPPKYVFVCGSNPFVETASQGVLAAGVGAEMVRTERYGI